ncbi:MAG: hypothetical protein AVDCRST_MAG12-1121 [uncultured Rubrobacteraceae bacterium]|uniref:DUF3618 domain-containing protein n=1 Tax=uncultured Rubrobacteraceae bacterium TaxID=349277 RepID=A0A6J4RR61_9ACTN|nr:MAG: hypothetical protein AVDCRST_MAG12-1121 [uncultured Rubrobacteraceae bacterium]
MESNSGGSTQSGEVAQQAKQQGQQLAQQARQQANDLASRGGEQVKSQLANQKHEASQRLTPIQVALRETAQQLRKQGQAPVAGYADRTSDQVERFSGYLRETEVDEMVDQARGFARSRPAIFLGGAVALGFLGARFLKSSSQEAAGNGEPVAALPPTEGPPTAAGSTPPVERTPMTNMPAGGVDQPAPPQGI